MNKSGPLISQLFSIRNRYGKQYSNQKLKLLHLLGTNPVKSKKAIKSYHDSLLFLLAYPDNRSVYETARRSLQQLHAFIGSHEKIQRSLYNSGVTNTQLCAAFSFEIVKWLRINQPKNIKLSSFEADDGHIRYIVSAVLPKVESEILQDANATWKGWLTRSLKKGEDLLDRLITIFNQADIRPEVRDELWNALGINVEISFPSTTFLPDSLIEPYYQRSIINKNSIKKRPKIKPIQVTLSDSEADQVIACGRMILVRHLREIEPVTFTEVRRVSYYQLQRGLSVALMGMVPERRHPIDSYMGYVVFKNGLPISYAGSWILFDSARIGLNIFPAYRGGESQYIFETILKLHEEVYQLNRFSVDPYQIGKENDEGLKSGAFWTYYHSGFRPIREEQQRLAAAEHLKIKAIKGYRSSLHVMKILADSKLELVMQKKAVRFDAGDLSIAYADILNKRYGNDRNLAEDISFNKLARILQSKNHEEEKMKFILKNWCVVLVSEEQQLRSNSELKKLLKKLFELKATGAEEAYISGLQRAGDLKELIEKIVKENTG
ncbi:MAG TPA: hypothetical protein VNV85_06855 [Puia sp.]|jgi:hypothetical protein|nr:hypothetical protein [Puia sp.]